MTNDLSGREMSAPELERKPLSPAAKRALAEAEARRQAAAAIRQPLPRELQGPKGPEPARYGDCKNKGIASIFESRRGTIFKTKAALWRGFKFRKASGQRADPTVRRCDGDPLVEVGEIRVQHADAAIGHEPTD